MAMIACAECGKEISDRAKICPHCGNPMRESAPEKTESEGPRKKEKKERPTLRGALGLWLLIPLELFLVLLSIAALGADTSESTIMSVIYGLFLVGLLINVALGLKTILKAIKTLKSAKEAEKPIGRALIAAVLCFCFIFLNSLVGYVLLNIREEVQFTSPGARMARLSCQDLQRKLTNPDSMELHDVLVCEGFYGDTYVFIDCSAENSLGGAARNIFVYKNGAYLGDWDDQSIDIRNAKDVFETCAQLDMYELIDVKLLERALQ